MLLNLALAILSGLALAAIHPRWSFAWLAPFAITPLVWALARESRAAGRFLLGYAAGVVFWASICYWIQFVMAVHGRLGEPAGWGVFLLFSLLKGLHLGAFGLAAGILARSWCAAPALALLWVAIERIPGFFYFTWLPLGNAALDMSVPMRLVPFTGVYGASFVFALLGATFALVLLRRPRREYAFVLALPAMYLLPELPAPERGDLSAVALQPNLPEGAEWTVSSVEAMQRRIERLTAEAAFDGGPPRGPILWPEVPAPIYYYDDPPLRERLAALARTTGRHLLIGTVAYNEHRSPLNSALMISPEGSASGRYDKMFLVPFGEYVPFPFGSLTRAITDEPGDFAPGRRIVVFDAGASRIGAFICYESAFPHLVRQFAAQGANVLANLTNDGYFARTAARDQHLALVRMRAAENRRWILRVANDGTTASIDPAGRIVARLPAFIERSGRLPYSLRGDLTFYSRYGDLFAWLCAAGSAILLVLSRFSGNPN